MVWIYISVLLLILILEVFYIVKKIKVIRVFGFELLSLLFGSLLVILIIGEIIIPIPKYYIKPGEYKETSLNEVLKEETLRAGIEFTDGSFKILDSYGMHFNHLFLCSYEIDGKEEIRFIQLEKNIFGNMKLKYPLEEKFNIITGRNSQDNYYGSVVSDGIFAEYLVTVGYGDDSAGPINFKVNNYTISKNPQKDYFLWVEMSREPWKSALVRLALYTGIILIVARFKNNKKEPIKLYSKWIKGDNIITCTKNVSQ